MATPEGAGRDEVSIEMAPAAAGGEVEPKASAAAKSERRLNRFVRFIAFGEWAGNAFGALAFLWATAVVLGGFCTSLKAKDFWFATVMIFIEAVRIFSRGYRLDNQSLFGTTRALKWISSSFTRMLWRPRDGDEIVLIMGLWIDLIDQLPLKGFKEAIEMALLILMSRRPRRPGRVQIWAVLIACLAGVIYTLKDFISISITSYPHFQKGFFSWPDAPLLADTIQFVAVLLLLHLRPNRTDAILTGTPCRCRLLLSLAKVISVVWLVGGLVMNVKTNLFDLAEINYILGTSFASVVLSLSSLQTHLTSNDDHLLGQWIDVIHRICFLWVQVFPLPDYFFYYLGRHPTPTAQSFLSLLIISALLLIGNLQIPAAIVQVVLASLRFHQLRAHDDYSPIPEGSSKNIVPALEVFYVLALCQGSLYIMASILGLFSFFPRRSLVRQSNLYGRHGAKAIDLYYQHAYATCMDTGLLSASKTMSLANFALESLHSSSEKVRLAGVLLLDRLLSEEQDDQLSLKSRIISSNTTVTTLVGMLRTEVRDRYISLFAARATAKLAGSIRIAEIPGTIKLVSSLFDNENQQQDSVQNRGQVSAYSTVVSSLNNGEGAAASQPQGQEPSPQSILVTNGSSWVRQCWQRMKEKWSILEEPPSSPQDSFAVLGMVILEKLASDLDNCAEILKDKILMSKIIGLIRYDDDDATDNEDKQKALVRSSLNLLRRLAATGESIGVAFRQAMWRNNFLLNSLIDVLEDGRSSPQVWETVMDIIAKLALNKRAGHQIGKTQVIVARLLQAFLGRDESTGTYYDQYLRLRAGGALANIARWGTTNCLAILAEPGYEVIKDAKNMLSEHSYRDVAANLLWNICAHGKERLCHCGASEHLSSSLPVVMENIMSAEGKQLESLIGLASQMYEVIPSTFTRELDSHTSATVLVQNLVHKLNSNKKPSPEYPSMRRVIIEITTSITKSCPRYANIFKEEGMMEALTTVERTPSKLEKYRVIYGNVGIVVESGTPLPILAVEAKRLIDSAAALTNVHT